MRKTGFLACIVTLSCGLSWSAGPAAAQRFEAFLRNGERLTGERLENLDEPGAARLDGRPLFAGANPLRGVRDLHRASRRQGMCVELTNGDVLPGRIVGWAAAGYERPAHFLVAADEALGGGNLGSGTIAVRADCVRRVYWAGAKPMAETPGVVVAHDGRRAVARSVRFSATAVQALTETGIVTIDFADLRELHLAHAPALADVLRDGVWSAADDPAAVVRLATAGGAELTFARPLSALVVGERQRRGQPAAEHLAIRPAWALETLYVNAAMIVSYSYRDADEVPLSLLPAETLEQRAILHRWPWRRNASVEGGRLQSGAVASDVGVGMPSGTAVAFTLPPGAREFHAWVGVDAAVGAGGCVVCRVLGNDLSGPVLWESGFLRGGQNPVRVGPLAVGSAARLVLAVDFAHEGRPADADPWDVRDAVAWLDPVAIVDPATRLTPESEPERWIPSLAGWEMSADMRARLALRPHWDEGRKQWTIAMTTDRPGEAAPFALTRRMQVDLTNAVLPIVAANDNRGRTRHEIYVTVDGSQLDSTLNGAIRTRYTRRNEVASREWDLGPFREREIQLAVLIEPLGRSYGEAPGLIWQSLSPRPLVENLPPAGRPLMPDVALSSLAPLSATSRGQAIELQAGRRTDGEPLAIRGWRFDEGVGVPTDSELVYRLEPQWRRFVSIIGLAGGWQGAGPFSIWLDGSLHWECTSPMTFGRNTPALQIDVPIPPGHQTIALRVQGEDSHAAWALAGFCE